MEKADRKLYRIERAEFRGAESERDVSWAGFVCAGGGDAGDGSGRGEGGAAAGKAREAGDDEGAGYAAGDCGAGDVGGSVGNLITNIGRDEWEERLKKPFVLRAGLISTDRIVKTYGAVKPGEALAYWGSAGVLEIGVSGGSAAKTAIARSREPVLVEWK